MSRTFFSFCCSIKRGIKYDFFYTGIVLKLKILVLWQPCYRPLITHDTSAVHLNNSVFLILFAKQELCYRSLSLGQRYKYTSKCSSTSIVLQGCQPYLQFIMPYQCITLLYLILYCCLLCPLIAATSYSIFFLPYRPVLLIHKPCRGVV